MKGNLPTAENPGPLQQKLRAVRVCMLDPFEHMPSADMKNRITSCLQGGKMLRARMILRLAPACGAREESAVRSAAAIELVHAASLLHDDVIDGGHLRRAEPAFWVRQGVQAAILVGDLLLCEASRLLDRPGEALLLRELIARTREVCLAEVEQELVLRGHSAEWKTALRLARYKTGSLFAFCAVAACGTDESDTSLRSALREAGYRAGTAYQLSDDVLDVLGDPNQAGKTLGRDSEREKITAGSARSVNSEEIRSAVETLRGEADALLAPFPDAASAWQTYWRADLDPVLARHLCFSAVAAG